MLTNEACTETVGWGRTSKNADPVQVGGAGPALISRAAFDAAQAGLRARAPKDQQPARAGSKFLLSGLLRCGRCGRQYVGHGAKSGQFAYYVCNTLHRAGAGACDGRYFNATKFEGFAVGQVLQRILNEQTIMKLVQLVAEEVDAMAEELAT